MQLKFFILSILISCCYLKAQQDPDAKLILDKVAQKTKSFKTIKTEFIININDRKTHNNSKINGKIYIKGDKYRYETGENIIYFDGKYLYNYFKGEDELAISDIDPNEEDLLNNPIKIIYVYNKDFKYRYNGTTKLNNKEVHEIDLFPKNLKQPYTRIKLYIDTLNLLLNKFIISGKDGVDIIVELNKYELNVNLPESFFVVPDDIMRKTEVIDLRKK